MADGRSQCWKTGILSSWLLTMHRHPLLLHTVHAYASEAQPQQDVDNRLNECQECTQPVSTDVSTAVRLELD